MADTISNNRIGLRRRFVGGLLQDLELSGGCPCFAPAPAESESEEDDLVDPAFVFGQRDAFDGFADLACRGLELIPDVAFALAKKVMLRVDHDNSDCILDHGLASDRRAKWSDDDVSEPAALRWAFGSRWLPLLSHMLLVFSVAVGWR